MNKDLYLLDKQFLNEMAEQKERDIYARIISLDINENPIEQIEGKITTGSINIDGSSAIRRTCSLTMVSQEVNITDYYWGVKTKFKLKIGLKNKINKKYPDIIWYPQGIYVITSFNTSLSTNNCTISIQGKDKMCLLNGDVSGQMYASIDFGTEEVINTEMSKVDFSYAYNSQQIMSQAIQKYYICDFSNINSSNPEPTIKKGDSNYAFIKKSNDKNNNDNIKTYNYNQEEKQYIFDDSGNGKYKLYKIIEEPNEIFKESNNNKDYINNNNYYYIDTPGTSPENHYQLKDIYQRYDSLTKEKNSLNKIIREAVHTYGKEPYHNIIINDLENYGLEQITYKGDVPLYAFKDVEEDEYVQLLQSSSNNELNTILNSDNFHFDESNGIGVDEQATKIIKHINPTSWESISSDEQYNIQPGETLYVIKKFTYGDDIGYRLTDLVYTGDLISNVGDSLTSILDKIKTMLGDFEYFYDLDGRFIFQKKKTYINVSWNTMIDNKDEKYFTFANDESKFSFNFEGNRLISAIQNSPKITNLRNDFSVWGKRKNTSGVDIDIHMRYAIDKKPVYYKALDGKEYYTNQYINANKQYVVDWREIIYQMALDYFAGQGCSPENPIFLSNSNYSLIDPDQFLYEVGQRNPEYYPTGYTGYEQYYTDMQGFWRLLYNPDYQPEPTYNKGSYNNNKEWTSSSIENYTIEYYINEDKINIEENSPLEEFIGKYILDSTNDKLYWNIAVFEAPETLNFWIDFLDSNLELFKFSVPQIGDRSKTVKDDKAGAIIYKEIPNLILYEPKYNDPEKENQYKSDWKKMIEQRAEIINKSGYRFINLSKGFSQFFTISYRSKSVKNKVDDLLYEHSYAQDGITITSIPIYHLEPNTIIYVKDDNTGINGEYIATKFTIPLNYNGTMSITANKAPERIY